jgi:hypothetical protein
MTALLGSLQKYNLEPSNLLVIVTDDMPSVIGSSNCVVFLLYKHMQRLGLQNELIQYHRIINKI